MRRRWGLGSRFRWLLALASMVTVAVAWAISSPVGSAADDDTHLATIWCAWGASDSCVASPDDLTLMVPREVGEKACFALLPGRSAECLAASRGGWVEATMLIGYNPPVFYRAMGLFVGPDVVKSVIIMRLANALLATLLWVWAFMLARRPARVGLIAAWTVGLLPFGLYFIPSTNPSSWAIISAGVFWSFLTTAVAPGPETASRRMFAWMGVIIALVVGLGARSDSIYILGVLSVAVLVTCWRPSVTARRLATTTLIGIPLVALVWLYTSSSRAGEFFRNLSNVSFPSNPSQDQPHALVKLGLEIPQFFWGMTGSSGSVWSQRNSESDAFTEGFAREGLTYGLGWIDLQMPSLVSIVALVAVSALLFINLRHASRRSLAGAVLVVLAIAAEMLLPVAQRDFTLVVTVRYFYPLYFGGLGLVLIWKGRLPTRLQLALLSFSSAIAASVALRATLGRYVHGQSHSYVQLTSGPHWWWEWGLSPDMVWAIGTLAGLVVATIVVSQGGVREVGGVESRLGEIEAKQSDAPISTALRAADRHVHSLPIGGPRQV